MHHQVKTPRAVATSRPSSVLQRGVRPRQASPGPEQRALDVEAGVKRRSQEVCAQVDRRAIVSGLRDGREAGRHVQRGDQRAAVHEHRARRLRTSAGGLKRNLVWPGSQSTSSSPIAACSGQSRSSCSASSRERTGAGVAGAHGAVGSRPGVRPSGSSSAARRLQLAAVELVGRIQGQRVEEEHAPGVGVRGAVVERVLAQLALGRRTGQVPGRRTQPEPRP